MTDKKQRAMLELADQLERAALELERSYWLTDELGGSLGRYLYGACRAKHADVLESANWLRREASQPRREGDEQDGDYE